MIVVQHKSLPNLFLGSKMGRITVEADKNEPAVEMADRS
jgi:hypothetical protein